MKHLSSKQLMYSVATYIISSSLLTKAPYAFLKNDAWIAIVLAVVASLIVLQTSIFLAKKYPGMSLIELNDRVFGPVVGKAVSLLYIFYILSLAILNTNDLGAFIKAMILPNTPLFIIYGVFLGVCIMSAAKGAVSMTRYAALFTLLTIAILVINGSMLLNTLNLKNLLPMFALPTRNYLLGTHSVTIFPLCDTMIFLMFCPYLRSGNDYGKGLVKGVLIGGATLLFIVLRDTAVLGSHIAYASQPTFTTIRLINIGDILTRLEIIYAVTLISLYFFKVSTLCFAAVSGLGRLLKFESYKTLLYCIGALAVIYSGAVFQSPFEHTAWKMSAAVTYGTFFVVVLPVVTVITSVVRDFVNRSPPNPAENTP